MRKVSFESQYDEKSQSKPTKGTSKTILYFQNRIKPPILAHFFKKNRKNLDIVSEIWGVVTTAAMGKPLPIPLAMVTMSGTTPWPSKPQKWSPVRPKPVWTCSK